VLLGRFEHGQFPSAEPAVVGGKERALAGEALLHRRRGQPLGDPGALRLVGAVLAKLGHVVLTMGIVEVPEPRRALAPQGHPAPEQGAGGAPRCRRDSGRREHPAAEQPRDCPGGKPVVLRFAALDGWHRQGMAEDKRSAVGRTQGGEPVPRTEARHGDDKILSLGGNDLQKRRWAGLHIAMPQALTVVVEHTDVQGADRYVDATGKWVVLRRESPEVASSSA
jgi:hypothetical protein